MLTGTVENGGKTHSVAKFVCFQKGTVDSVRKGFRVKATVDSGPQKLAKVYFLSRDVYLRPQMCGTWCLGMQSCELLLRVWLWDRLCTSSRTSRDVCPSLHSRSCLTTGTKPHSPLTLPLSLMTACPGESSWYTPWWEDLPEDALCYGDMTQDKMQDLSEPPLQLTEGQQLI